MIVAAAMQVRDLPFDLVGKLRELPFSIPATAEVVGWTVVNDTITLRLDVQLDADK